MGKPTGFLEYNRETAKVLPPKVRIANFKEFRTPLNKEKQKLQGARCMACGVPFCQAGMMIGGMASGCPLHNLVPETNDLVFTGNWKQAFLLIPGLMSTNAIRDVLIGDTLSGIIRLIAALLLAAALALGFMGAIILFGRFGL